MSSILGGGETQIINQTAGGGDFLKNFGNVLQQASPQESTNDPDALIEAFIKQLTSEPVNPQEIIASQPTTSGNVTNNLGSVGSRLLKGRAQGGGVSAPVVPPLVLPPSLGGLGPGAGGGNFAPQLPLNTLLNFSQPKFPPIFNRQPF